LVLVLVPLTTMSALVLMLLAARSSLPWLASAAPAAAPPAAPAVQAAPASGAGQLVAGEPEPEPVRRTLLAHLGSGLLPCLAGRPSCGYLKQDFRDYDWGILQDLALDEKVERRLGLGFSVTLVAIVVVAVVARWLLGRWRLAKRRPWLGLFGAYLEVIWI